MGFFKKKEKKIEGSRVFNISFKYKNEVKSSLLKDIVSNIHGTYYYELLINDNALLGDYICPRLYFRKRFLNTIAEPSDILLLKIKSIFLRSNNTSNNQIYSIDIEKLLSNIDDIHIMGSLISFHFTGKDINDLDYEGYLVIDKKFDNKEKSFPFKDFLYRKIAKILF